VLRHKSISLFQVKQNS